MKMFSPAVSRGIIDIPGATLQTGIIDIPGASIDQGMFESGAFMGNYYEENEMAYNMGQTEESSQPVLPESGPPKWLWAIPVIGILWMIIGGKKTSQKRRDTRMGRAMRLSR